MDVPAINRGLFLKKGAKTVRTCFILLVVVFIASPAFSQSIGTVDMLRETCETNNSAATCFRTITETCRLPSPMDQEEENSKDEELSETTKSLMYVSQKKSPGTAVIFSLLLTSAGHAYAGKWPRGLLFSLGRIGFGVLAITQGFEEETECSDWICVEETKLTEMYYMGIIGIIALGIVEAVDAYHVTEDYNNKLRERIYSDEHGSRIQIIPQNNGVNLQYSFDF